MEIKKTIKRIDVTKSYFFNKVNKKDKLLAKLSKRREKNKLIKFKMKVDIS
jgi:hypothetical protein